MTALTPIVLDPSQPYMYIDLTFPNRAIYFPLAQKPSKVFPDLCSYLMVDFRLRQGVEMWNFPMVEQAPPQDAVEMDPDEEAAFLSSLPRRSNVSTNQRTPTAKGSYPMKFDLYAGLGAQKDRESKHLPGLV